MSSAPKVTIQIPAYNQERYIGAAIESALQQDHRPLEVLVADDCSKDGTAAVIQTYKDERLRFVQHPKNLGRIGNYHTTLYEHSSGDWVVNLDGDDFFIDPSFISFAMQQVETAATENVVMFQGNHNIEKIKRLFPEHIKLTDDTVMLDGREYFINYYKVQRFKHCATLYKRSTALPLDFYSFDCLFTDFNSMARLFLQGKIILTGRTVASWRHHEGNLSSGLNEKNIEKEFRSVEALASFAQPWFSDPQIAHWEKKMKAYMVTTYIELLNHQPRSAASMKYIVNHFTANLTYLKQLFRYFVRL